MECKKRILLYSSDKEIEDLIYNYLSEHFCVMKKYSSSMYYDLVIMFSDSKYQIEKYKEIIKDMYTKVIVISHDCSSTYKEYCFQYLCDDFIQIPFSLKELEIRVLNLLGIYHKSNLVKSGIITLDTRREEIFVSKSKILLSETEYLILYFMLKNKNYTHRSEEIKKYIEYKRNIYLSASAISVTISRLRKKLYKYSGMKIIKTKYRRGYYLVV